MGPQTFLRGAFVSALVALLAAETRATIVVDPSGGGDFTQLQDAIDVARDGEQILVKAGTYASPAGFNRIQIVGKGLSIVAEAGAVVNVPGFDLDGLPEGHWVMARGLTLSAVGFFGFGAQPTVNLTSAGGTLLLEACSITGADGEKAFLVSSVSPGSPAVRVAAGAAAILKDCTVRGGNGMFESSSPPPNDPTAGGAGIEVEGGRLAVYGGTVTGGNGGSGSIDNPFFYFVDGGDGVKVSAGGFAHLTGTVVTGGSNGLGNQVTDDKSGDGLHVLDASSSAWVRDTALAAGSVAAPAGTPGLALNAPAGTVTSFAAAARSLTITSPLREGQPGTMTIQGETGDLAYVVISLGAAFQPLSPKQGVLLLDTSLLVPVAVGVITAPSGTLTVPFTTPDLNPALGGLTVPMQLAVSAAGKTTLESATLMGWLDASL